MGDFRASHFVSFAGFSYALAVAASIGFATYAGFDLLVSAVDEALRSYRAPDFLVEPGRAEVIVVVGALLGWLFFALPGLILLVLAGTEQAAVRNAQETARLVRTNEVLLNRFEALRSEMAEQRYPRPSGSHTPVG